jgi:hypothetical protein
LHDAAPDGGGFQLLLFPDVLTFVALFDTLRYQYHVEAAKEGYAPAQFNAGTHYFIGQGVEQDFAKAFSWFQKASDQGNNTKICLCVSSVCIVLCPPLISIVVFLAFFFCLPQACRKHRLIWDKCTSMGEGWRKTMARGWR